MGVIVNTVKQLHPALRHYDGNQKLWAVDCGSLAELLTMFKESPDIELDRNSSLDVLCAEAHKQTQERKRQEIELERQREEKAAHEKRQEEERRLTEAAAYQKRQDEERQRAEIVALKTAEMMRMSALEQHTPLKRASLCSPYPYGTPEKRLRNFSPCDLCSTCGERIRISEGKHVCRMFGKFRCTACNGEWSSAYCWYYPDTGANDGQDCRRCETPGELLDMRRRDTSGRLGRDIHGAHDCDRCDRCQKFGRDCTGGRGTWSKRYDSDFGDFSDLDD